MRVLKKEKKELYNKVLHQSRKIMKLKDNLNKNSKQWRIQIQNDNDYWRINKKQW